MRRGTARVHALQICRPSKQAEQASLSGSLREQLGPRPCMGQFISRPWQRVPLGMYSSSHLSTQRLDASPGRVGCEDLDAVDTGA